jgi:protein O-mannosyl-transferase
MFRSVVFCSVLAVAIVCVYSRTFSFSFVNYDDDEYLYQNQHVMQGLSPHNVVWAFTTTSAGNYHPLTWLSHMLDVTLFGMNAGAHHAMNVVLHCVNALLLFALVQKLFGNFFVAVFVSMLFALHPLNVESVAWLSERKNTLSTLFYFLSLYCYAVFAKEKKKVAYLGSFFLFLIGLFAKQMLVTMPFVLLLLDLWPLGRLSIDFSTKKRKETIRGLTKLVYEKIPFFVCALIFSIIVYIVQQKGGAVQSFNTVSLPDRVAQAFYAYLQYPVKALWPAHLAVPYLFEKNLGFPIIVCSVMFFALVSIICTVFCKKLPHCAFGWWYYVLTLLPVIGLVQIGDQSMADRYTYITLIGPFITAGFALNKFFSTMKNGRTIKVLFCAILAIAVSAVAYRQTSYWRNGVTLMIHAVTVTKNNFRAYNNLGLILYEHGEIDRSIELYRNALAIKPTYILPYNNLGNSYLSKHRYDTAAAYFKTAIRLDPQFAQAHNGLGVACFSMGDTGTALAEFKEALRINPGYLSPGRNLDAILSSGAAR